MAKPHGARHLGAQGEVRARDLDLERTAERRPPHHPHVGFRAEPQLHQPHPQIGVPFQGNHRSLGAGGAVSE